MLERERRGWPTAEFTQSRLALHRHGRAGLNIRNAKVGRNGLAEDADNPPVAGAMRSTTHFCVVSVLPEFGGSVVVTDDSEFYVQL